MAFFPPRTSTWRGGGDLERADLVLQVGDVVLDLNERLCDHRLGLVGGGGGRIRRALNFVVHGCHLALQLKSRTKVVRERSRVIQS